LKPTICRFVADLQFVETQLNFMTYLSNCEQKTLDFASTFSSSLKGGEVFLLDGTLGSGKSVFIRGIATGLGIKNRLTSPTFVIMKIYSVKKRNSSVKRLIHVDAYRVEAEDLFQIGLQEYLNDPQTAVFIEWGSKVEKKFKKSKINFTKIKIRKVKASASGGNKLSDQERQIIIE